MKYTPNATGKPSFVFAKTDIVPTLIDLLS